jgi:protein disulfide-isomerase A6
MRPQLLLVACVLAATACYVAAVQELTPDDFDSVVDGSKNVFVKFYAPWCGHCKRMAADYDKIGEAFGKVGDVVIAKVDADKHKDLGSRFGVKGFPTLKFFPKGSTTPEDYSGGRDPDDIINFINGKAGSRVKLSTPPSNVVVLTPENFDKIVLDSSKDVLVEFYAPWCGHCKSLAPIYDKLATVYKPDSHVVIAKVDADKHKELATKYGVSGYPTLIFFPKTDKAGVKYEAGRDLKDFVAYLNEKAGTQRTEEGRLSDKAGRLEALDALAKEFAAAAETEHASILAKAEAALAAVEETLKKDASYYVKVMKTAAEKGKDFIKTETQRIARMMTSAMKDDKLDEFTKRKNILDAFEH